MSLYVMGGLMLYKTFFRELHYKELELITEREILIIGMHHQAFDFTP